LRERFEAPERFHPRFDSGDVVFMRSLAKSNGSRT
jgi:hypothetical protein